MYQPPEKSRSVDDNVIKEQMTIYGLTAPKVINVSSVPQLSPFRYPGGKTWLIPYLRQWLIAKGGEEIKLIEPFAGGCIVSLTAVIEGRVKNALMVELDDEVASVWYVILNGDVHWLIDQIKRFEVTQINVESILQKENKSLQEKAFATLLKNRVSHGGILANGAGLLKKGESGRGILSRWYPETIISRIHQIYQHRDSLEFIHTDGIQVIQSNLKSPNSIFFIDPPYTVAGRRLYRFSDVDHNSLFNLIVQASGDFLITYDDADEIRSLLEIHNLEHIKVPMMNTHHAKKFELLIGRDLSWFHQF